MIDKPAIVADIRGQFADWLKKWKLKADLFMMCFYFAVFTHGHLKEMGKFGRCLISAGSFSIPRMNLADDDGVVATHFGYTFTPDQKAMEEVQNDRMPEMHCWVQLPDCQEIVDLSTCYVKSQCKKLAGLDWLAPNPPDFVWHHPFQLPAGITYKPDPHAVALVQYFFKTTWG
jgi:hypothetical protein